MLQRILTVAFVSLPGFLLWTLPFVVQPDAGFSILAFLRDESVIKGIIRENFLIIGALLTSISYMGTYAVARAARRKKDATIHKRFASLIHKRATNGAKDEVRVTIFVVCPSYKIIFPYIYAAIFRNFLTHFKRGILLRHILKIPLHGDYLRIIARDGHPYSEGTSTIFRVPRLDKEVDSVAARAVFTEGVQDVKVSDDAKLCDEKYASQTFMNNVKDIALLHNRPIAIYASPLFNVNEKVIGVIVVDSKQPDVIKIEQFKEHANAYQEFLRGDIENVR